jgi:hypothetical protein
LSIYADTSFFVSLYLPDRHSAVTEQRMASKPQIWLPPLHIAEWTHALSQHVFRKEISLHEAHQADDELERDRGDGLWLEADLPEAVWKTCTDLASTGPSLACVPWTACLSLQRWNSQPRPSGPSTNNKPNSPPQ